MAATAKRGSGAAPSAREPVRLVRIAVALVAAGAFVAYLPALRAEFVNWDDPGYVTENPMVHRVAWESIRWAFTTFTEANWHPLTWLSHMLDALLFGPNPHGHHLTSVLLHAVNAALLLLVLHRMTGAVVPSALVAALFALHPLNVESVAWISERKNLVSALFWILAMGAHARYAERPSARRYAAVFLLVALGLMAKPMLVTLPFVLLLLDVWPLGRFSRRAVLEKVPLLILSALSSLVTVAAQRGAMAPTWAIPVGDRVANAAVSYVRYLVKAVWPTGLSAHYPLPGREGAAPIGPVTFVLSLAALVIVTALAVRSRRRAPHVLVGWLWYLGTLVPVIGLVQVGLQAMADRYMYVPLLGVFIAVAWSLPLPGPRSEARTATPRTRARAGGAATAAAAALLAALVALGAATSARARVWRDSESLWQATLAIHPDSRNAHTNYGNWLLKRGRREEAIRHLRRALEIDPNEYLAENNLGVALREEGRLEEALACFRDVLRIKPDNEHAQYNIAVALGMLGRPEEGKEALARALTLYLRDRERAPSVRALAGEGDPARDLARAEAALAARPGDPGRLLARARALERLGRAEDAARAYEEVLARDPGHAVAHTRLTVLLADAGRFDDAIEHYRLAIAGEDLDPRIPNDLAVALIWLGRPDDAAECLRNAVRIRPDFAEAWYHLGIAEMQRGGLEEAAKEFAEAIRCRPDYADALVNLGAVLSRMGRVPEAADKYREAIRANPGSAEAYTNLGLALAWQGRREEAVRVFRDWVGRGGAANVEMATTLAWILATAPEEGLRSGEEAVAVAERLVAATGRRDRRALDALGAAYAEVGRFAEARAAAEDALARARAEGDSALAIAIEGRISLYARGVPFRESG